MSFIDEASDFGETNSVNDNYIVTFVFHDQRQPIDKQISALENSLISSAFPIEYIHTGPIIWREDVFASYSLDERRSLLYKILSFSLHCPIKYVSVIVSRKEASTKQALAGKLSCGISSMVQKHKSFFERYERTIVYYDQGQHELSVILSAIFSSPFENIDFRVASPQKYRLLQVADFLCSIELLRIKSAENRLSNSEKMFFYKPQELKNSKRLSLKH